jgi:hypothetical protein
MTYRFNAFNPEDEVSISPEFWVPETDGKIKIVRQYGRFVIMRPIGVYVEALPLGPVNFPSSNPSS